VWCHNSTVWRFVGRVPPVSGGVQMSRQQRVRGGGGGGGAGGGGGGGGGGGPVADALAPTLARTRSPSGSFGTQPRIAASAAFRGARVLRRSLHALLFLGRGAPSPPPTRYKTACPRPTSSAAGHSLTSPRRGAASPASGAGVHVPAYAEVAGPFACSANVSRPHGPARGPPYYCFFCSVVDE